MNALGTKPPWLRRRLAVPGRSSAVIAAIKARGLHTVCEEAHCPNQLECFSHGTATFLLLGPSCTRRCTFCAVGKSHVHPVDPAEPSRIAQAVVEMGLKFCVITMVTRDDLSDIKIGAFGMCAYFCPQPSKPRYYKPLTPIYCVFR